LATDRQSALSQIVLALRRPKMHFCLSIQHVGVPGSLRSLGGRERAPEIGPAIRH